MLREISSTRQINVDKSKRWFTDSNMELFIWFKNQMPVSFQLSYNKCQLEHSINWNIKTGFTHYLIKPEHRHIRHRISSCYPAERTFDTRATAREFLRASEHINVSLADFIFARLLEYPAQLEINSSQALVS
jgi:hypothetical protein